MNLACLFPGQGTQKPGMLRELGDALPLAEDIFTAASDITGRDVRQLCLNASEAELRQTQNTQLAVTAMNLAFYAALTHAGVQPQVVMGHSLGQFSALYAAGVLSLEDTFRVVEKRAELMAACGGGSALCTVLGLHPEQVDSICRSLDPSGESITVALHNTETQVVIGGTEAQIALAEPLCKQAGALRTIAVKVSHAFHTPLMRPMEEGFSGFVQDLELHEPKCRIILNCKGDFAENIEDIRQDMILQCCHTVHFYAGLKKLLALPELSLCEVGIGKTLAGMVRSTDPSKTTYLLSNPRQRMQCIARCQEGGTYGGI